MTQTKKICIHGHFYQPPRIDPWLRELLPEGSAAPGLNWNARILTESYAPLAWARRKNGQGRITDIVNCYEWISFNFGPTLLSWLQNADPDCYARILEADQRSLRRWGHGNALAQCYHHMIMPLASPLDKELQLNWTKVDFQVRYGRDPEGIWLSEAAVDTATLEAVARTGFRFVILAPRQAAALTDLKGNNEVAVSTSGLDIGEPYLAALPSGNSLAIFFYHGPLSQAVAFERLLENGDQFHRRLVDAAGPGLLSLATDGETYGHHFPFGEMALAYVLEQLRSGHDGVELTNFAAYLSAHPPRRRVLLHEPSSWSCVHGVERWRSNCGCTDGGHPDWNQQWRGPLRRALENNKNQVDAHFLQVGPGIFRNAHQALLDYPRLLAGGITAPDFVQAHFRANISATKVSQGFDLLAMQEWAMCSLASCAWFFDELSRVEPLNALTYALRSLELAEETGATNWKDSVLPLLATAWSNQPELGNGVDLWRGQVAPRRMQPASWTLLALLLLEAGGRLAPGVQQQVDWPGAQVRITLDEEYGSERYGTVSIRHPWHHQEQRLNWLWTRSDADHPWADVVRVCRIDVQPGRTREYTISASELAWNRKELVCLAWLEKQAEQWWEQQTRFGTAARGYFLKWQEDQHGQNREQLWLSSLPGLAWAFVVNTHPPAEPAQFLKFLRDHWQPHAEFDARINARILDLLRVPAPDWDRLARIMDRIRTLGVPLNLWAVENKLWEMGLHRPEIADLARRIWFAC
jgi:hypothetical protein